MKFVQSCSKLTPINNGAEAVLDELHPIRFEAITPNIIRVSVKKGGEYRLNRTWSVAQGEAEVPLEGVPRDKLPGQRASCQSRGREFSTTDVKVRVHSEPYYLEWFHKNKAVLTERKTGALAFGRRDRRLWHFHQLKEASRFYGLGERTGEIDRRGRSFELRNVDPMGYDAKSSDPLYKHFPFYIEDHAHGFVGIFYDNYANARLNFGEEIDNYHGPFTSYRAEDGDLDMYLIFCSTLIEVTQKFSWLTGRTYLPPKWSLGYSSTSMTYTDLPNAQERLEQFLEESEKHQIPVKTFKFGSGYTSKENKRYVFTWNEEKFPDAKALTAQFKERKIRLNANIKPVLLKDHPHYEACRALFVQDSEKDQQELSQFWDNEGSHLDFTNPKTIQWWQSKAKEQLLDYGFDALWNDNNEYVVWDDEARCHGFGEGLPITLIRPLMSLWMTRASHEITQAQEPDKRVWSISRCGSPGMQRYAQTWSGDNLTHWDTLEYNNKMALGLSMSGVYNIGHDTGGFAGPAPTPELLARWFFIGAFTPRFGVNSWKSDGTITEPWMHPEALPAIKRALGLRMQFMPELYSLMVEAHRHYTPLLRPTFMNFPDDPECHEHDTEFMWGENLLVAPVLKPEQETRLVYLPEHKWGWWDFATHKHYSGGQVVLVSAQLDEIPLFVKAGSCLFLAEPGADSIDGPEHYRELRIYPGGHFSASFYDDDGETHSGDSFQLDLRVEQNREKLDVDIEIDGEFRPNFNEIRITAPERFELSVDSILLEDE